MARNIGHILQEHFPAFYDRFLSDWRRVFYGGISRLTPREDVEQFNDNLRQMAAELGKNPTELLTSVARYQGLLRRSLSSSRARKRIYGWLRRQPRDLLGIRDDDPFALYLREVEDQAPRGALALTPRRVETTLAAEVRRWLVEASAARGEALWTLLRTGAADVFRRYEATVELVVRAETARRSSERVLPGKVTFGNMVRALSAHQPPHIGPLLEPDANKLRNAFLHPQAFLRDDGVVELADENGFEWKGRPEDLLPRFRAMIRFSDRFDDVVLVAFIEHLVDLIYQEVDIEKLVHSVGKLGQPDGQDRLRMALEGAIKLRLHEASAAIPHLPSRSGPAR